ncbi:MAG: antibiotic biosynthesis monooxygenase [Bryobacterales bacterium]|nr:antibiotic biosynthesis monooxygenase [Bryobacterales bacterium]
MPTNNFVVAAHFRAKPGKEKDLESLLLSLVGSTRQEAGCLLYDLHRDETDPSQFLFYEIWANRQAWEAHMASPHLKAFKPVVEENLAEPFQIWQLRQIEPDARG